MLFLVVVVWLILRKRRGGSWDDIFEKDTDGPVNFHPSRLVRDPNMSPDMRSEMEPKPYQYGLVGPSGTPPFASPPESPTDLYYPQHIVPDNGRTRAAHTHSRNRSFSPDNNQYMHDNRRSFSPEYNQHARQYSVDRIETQHNRRPSSTSLLYSPLQLPTTAISPEPSVASVYSATSRPAYDRDNSSGSGSRPPTGNSRHSNSSAVSRSSTRNSAGPAGPRRLKRSSRPDDFSSAMPPPAEHGARPLSADSQDSQGKHRRPSNDAPVSPRTLTLTNWNPSTDAISFDTAAARKSVGSREQPRGQQQSSALSTGVKASPRAGPSSSANVIIHTDGGTVGGDMHASDDVKQMPAEEEGPPAYSG